MVISSYNNNQYIKLSSSYIDAMLANPSQYKSVSVKGTLNCGTDPIETLDLTTNGWYVDLTNPVNLEQVINILSIQNINTGTIINNNVNIDLAYVDNNCISNNCTLENYASHYTSIKTAIDALFLSIGITSNVVVTFIGNIIKVTNIPTGYIMFGLNVGIATQLYFNYGSSNNIYFFLSNTGLYVRPSFFSSSITFLDGIYTFTVKITSLDNSFVSETNCHFIDVLTKCQVAHTLNNIIKENEAGIVEKPSTIIHILHYSLVNGSDCGCNCDELCQVYNELVKLLGNTIPNLEDCGC